MFKHIIPFMILSDLLAVGLNGYIQTYIKPLKLDVVHLLRLEIF